MPPENLDGTKLYESSGSALAGYSLDSVEEALAAAASSHRSPRMCEGPNGADAIAASVHWSPAKSLWIASMWLGAIVGGPLFFSWDALLLFLATTATTVCLGHSLGMHRRLIHRAYDCPLWLERLFVYLGTLVGMAGPYGMIRQHDIRDWAQRKATCHPYLAHRSPMLRDAFWQLHCELRLALPPRLVIERRVAEDRFYQFIERTWMLQQVPWACAFYVLGGMPWVVWGIAVRVAASVTGHWLVGYFAHNRGPRSWHIDGAGVQGYNVPRCGLITMGEAWHNNHHAFPASARLGEKPGEWDPGWWVLCALRRVGLVWNIRTPETLPHRSNLLALGIVKRSRPLASLVEPLSLHAAAGLAALLYAALVHETSLRKTAVQFVGPLVVMLLIHLAWQAWRRDLKPGFSMLLLWRSLQTAAGLLVFVTLAAIYMPMPAAAQLGPGSEVIGPLLTVLFCLFVVALVGAVLAAIVYVLGRAAFALYNFVTRRRNNGPSDSRLFDVSVAATALVMLVVASLEGISQKLSFAAADSAAVTLDVAAPSERVWREVGKATSPAIPLPIMLKSIPQPVAVVVDEGAEFGARRVVHFSGRQGEGDLELQVVRRTGTEAVFEAKSDTSPISWWVAHRTLKFGVVPKGEGSRLTVALEYDRLLAPAWFFRPYIRLAAWLAVGVLARDTRQRAEAM